MKAVINGKIYNTQTAKRIATWDESGLGVTDLRYESDSLYITKKGTYFLYGEGHGMSQYGKSAGGLHEWGEVIKILTQEEALKWCESREIDSEEIKNFFELEEG